MTVICGATAKRTGRPCRRPSGWGTKHPGTGRCKLHGGASTGPRTPEGKAAISEANRTSAGLFADVLTGEDLVNFNSVCQFEPGQIVQANLWLMQARLKKLMGGEGFSGNRSYARQCSKLLQLADFMREQGELDEGFLKELRLRLHHMGPSEMASVLTSTAHLAAVTTQLERHGDCRRQLEICKQLMVNLLRSCADIEARQLTLQTLTLLKLEAGLPIEEMDRLLNAAQDGAEPDEIDNEPLEGEFDDEPVYERREAVDNQVGDPWS